MRLQKLEVLTGMMLSVLITAVSVYPASARPLGEAGSEQKLSQTDTNRNTTTDTIDSPNTNPTNDLTDTNPTNSTDTNNTPSTGTTDNTTDTNRTNTTIRRQERTIQQRRINETVPASGGTTTPDATTPDATTPDATSAPTVEQPAPGATTQPRPVRGLW